MTAKSFAIDLDKWVTKCEGRRHLFVRRFASEVARAITVGSEFSPGTPVDTGFARASWWASFSMAGEPSGPDGMGAVIAQAHSGDVIYMLNNAEYIAELEKGTSQQAPVGMVGVMVASADILAQRIVSELNP